MYVKQLNAIKTISAIITALLFAVACHSPVHRLTTDEAFALLIKQSKSYVERYPDSALMILHELLPAQQSYDKITERVKVMNLIGCSYDTKGMYDSAAYYLYEAARLAEVINDDSLQISVYTNLGILQFEMKNADEAINYYLLALPIAETLKDSVSIAKLLNNIGNTYLTLSSEIEKAIPYFEQSMEISAKIRDSIIYKVADFNLVQIYLITGELDRAMNEINYLTEHYGSYIYADYVLGEIYFQKGNFSEAIRTFQELLKKPLNTREFELVIIKAIANVYKQAGNLDSTVVYMEKSFALSDSLHNLQSTENINNLKIAYETEKKDFVISTLKEEKRFLIWLSIAGTGILLLILTALYLQWRWTAQKKRLVEKQKQLAEQQVMQLEQEKQLVATQAMLDGETTERSRIARDLHDGLGGMLSVVRLNLNDLKASVMIGKNEITRFNKAIGLLDDSIEEMRRVAHHLMPDALSRFGLKTALTDFLNVVPIVEFNYFGDGKRIDRKLEVVVYRIIHELVTNALKHAAASHILVQVIQDDDRIALTVEDNGSGFDPETITEGAGLRNIRTRVASFGGVMDLRAMIGKGTEAAVELRIEI